MGQTCLRLVHTKKAHFYMSFSLKLNIVFYLLLARASAPATISRISVVMAAWRVLL